MVIKYVPKNESDDSPDDPGGLIKEVLDMGAEFPGPAQDILLAWMLRLGDQHDAAAAAGRLVAAYGLGDGPPPEGACGELVKLLKQTAESPPEHLSGRRRGGWRRHER